jgi:hypothetical protein
VPGTSKDDEPGRRDPARDEETESHVGQRDPPAESALILDGIQALRGQLDELEHRKALRRPYQELTESRDLRRDDQTVILAGQAGPLRGMLRTGPTLAARFPAVIDFPVTPPGSSPRSSPPWQARPVHPHRRGHA